MSHFTSRSSLGCPHLIIVRVTCHQVFTYIQYIQTDSFTDTGFVCVFFFRCLDFKLRATAKHANGSEAIVILTHCLTLSPVNHISFSMYTTHSQRSIPANLS